MWACVRARGKRYAELPRQKLRCHDDELAGDNEPQKQQEQARPMAAMARKGSHQCRRNFHFALASPGAAALAGAVRHRNFPGWCDIKRTIRVSS